MHCVFSTRDLTALAYERGEEFDPATTPTPDLLEDIAAAMGATPLGCDPGSFELRRRRERESRALARVPAWFSADDLVPERLAAIHGEVV